MLRPTGLAIIAGISNVWAQANMPPEKKNYNCSDWTKGRFSEAVTVTGPPSWQNSEAC